jgi:predicted MFS family arabinose efflux permease
MLRLHQRWTFLGFLWIAFALNYVDRQAVFSIFPVLKHDLGFTEAELGLIGSMFLWVYALCMPIGGYIADAVRRDRLVVASVVFWSLALLGTSLSLSPVSFLGWRAVMGISEALYFPAALCILAELHPGPTRSRALGLHQAAQLAGIVIGGWYGGWVAQGIGWRTGFQVLAFGGIVYALVLLFPFRGFKQQRAERPNAAGSTKLLLRAPVYLALTAAFFCFCGVLWIVYAWIPNLLYERFGLSLARSGLEATFYIQASSGFGVIIGAWLADRLILRTPGARLYITGAAMLLSTPFAYLVIAAPSLSQFRLYATVFGSISGMVVANVFAAAYDAIRNRSYGFATGLLNMMGGISGGITMFLAGLWKVQPGIPVLTAWTAALTGIAALVLLVMTRRLKIVLRDSDQRPALRSTASQ